MEKPILIRDDKKNFRLEIFNSQIECTNFFKYTRQDFLTLIFLVMHGLCFYWLTFSIPIMILLLCWFPRVAVIIVPYYIWVFFYRKTPTTNGRKCRSKWFRNHSMYAYMRDYFPASLIKTADLPPGRNYFLASFPHALFPINTFLSLLLNVNHVDDLFPEIDMHFITHDAIFFLPLIREYFLAGGGHSCNESSIINLLESPPSKGVIIFPGGSAEIRLTTMGNIYKVKKSDRKGFIRVALKTGTPLVPVFNFGEINMGEQYFIFPTARRVKYFYNLDCFIPIGRGIFQNHIGIVMRQHPIVTVVGKPINVPKIENPSSEMIDEYHEKFFTALRSLFEEHKHYCDVTGNEAQLIMI